MAALPRKAAAFALVIALIAVHSYTGDALSVGTTKQLWEKFGSRVYGAPGNGLHHVREGYMAEMNMANTNVTTHFFERALLDHYAPSTSQRSAFWRQRFYVDTSFWCGEGCPIFLYIGGEGPQGPPSKRLFMAELAAQHGALMLALEHRFYGESQPTEDMSVENLRYLTSSQALADLARFRQYINDWSSGDNSSSPPLRLPASPRNAQWITFGGSYPGDLAAWFKLKFPSLTVGSVSSSAPVFALDDFEQYAEVVGSALGYELIGGSDACYNAVETAANALVASIGTGEEIIDGLKPCGSIAATGDLATYYATIFGNFQGAVQYNTLSSPESVQRICEVMTDESIGSEMERLAAVTQGFSKGCVASSFQDDTIAPLANVTFSAKDCGLQCSSMRQWIWQSCNEFGFFQTTTSEKQPFAAFKELSIKYGGDLICQEAYGLKSLPNTAWSNTLYGARDFDGVNVTIVNGSMDPWHSLGIVNATDRFFESCGSTSPTDCPPQRVEKSSTVVFIDGSSHCLDMDAEDPARPSMNTPSMKWGHALIADTVAKYLS